MKNNIVPTTLSRVKLQEQYPDLQVPWFLSSIPRLFAALFFGVALPVVLIILFIFSQVINSFIEDRQKENQMAAHLASQVIQEQIQGLTHYAESFSTRLRYLESLESKGAAGLSIQMKKFVEGNSYIDRVFITDRWGVLLFAYPEIPGETGKRPMVMDWFAGVSKSQRTFVSGLHPKGDNPEIYLTDLATPIWNTRREIIGYLVLQYPVEVLAGALRQIQPSVVRNLALVDSRGFVISCQGPGKDIQRLFDKDPLIKKILTDHDNSVEAVFPLTGKMCLISYEHVANAGWAVIASHPKDAIFSFIRSLVKTVVVLCVLCLIAMIAFGFLSLHTVRAYQKEIKRTLNDFGESRDYLSKIINSVADPIFVKDREHRWVFLNDAFCKFLGYSREALIGKSDYDFFPKTEADVFWQKDEVVFENKQEVANQEFLTDAEGAQHIILTRKTLYCDQFGSLRIVGIIRDITALKEAERVLLQKTEELARSRAQQEQLELFAFAASHDLQEPLRKIMTFSDLLQTRYALTLAKEGVDYLQRIGKVALQMSQMMKQLREFSSASQTPRPAESVDLKNVLEEVISDLELRIAQTGAAVELGEFQMIQGDKTQLKQLFQNLIGNAIKFVKKGEKPHIVIKSRSVDEEFIEITVADDGIGFEEKYLDKIFKPFQRLHSRDEYEGSGMGLSICQKIISNHHGQITARSSSGKGTVFVLRLPVRQPR